MALCLGHKFRAVDADGNPLAAGKIYTYDPGTTNSKTTYSDRALSVPNTNPVVLDAAGEADIYLSGPTKFVITTSADVAVDTVDSVDGVPANGDSPTFADLTVSDDLTVTDDASVGGDLTVTGNVNGAYGTFTGTVSCSGVVATELSAVTALAASSYINIGDRLCFTIAVAAASVANNSIFRDSADNIIKIKDSGGTVRSLY